MKISSSVKVLLVCALSLFAVRIAPAQNESAQKPAPVAPRITAAVDDSNLVTLTGNVHRMARPEFDQGAAPDALQLKRLMLVLKRSPEQEAALHTLLDEQQDSSSPNYHKWLTPDQFGQQFGPADADVQVVKGWLEAQGFQVTNVTRGRTVIEFSGSAAQVRKAFHTDIHKFNVHGVQHWANTQDPQIPAAIAPVVGAIHSLHNFFKQPSHVIVNSHATLVRKPGAAPAVNLNGGTHAIAPGDFATIYNVKPLYTGGTTGSGHSIGVIGRTNIDLNDVADFRSIFGLSATTSTVVLNGPDPGDVGGGEEIEALLDNEWSGGIGQGATVKFVVSESTETVDGVDLSALYIADNDLTDVMTESFTLCELALNNDINNGQLQFDLVLSEQAAAQGITFMAATGDAGAASCDNASEATAQFPPSVSLPASIPFVTAVGGTMFDEHNDDTLYWAANNNATDLSSALKYIPEEVWNESCAAGHCPAGVNPNLASGGGGSSAIFATPSYQTGVAGVDAHRDIPDISFNAAGHDGYIVCQGHGTNSGCDMGSVFIISGTSASTPSFAGIMSLVDQKTNSRQGLANFTLYRLFAGETLSNCNGSTLEPGTPPQANCIFNDTTAGNNSVPGATGFTAVAGYDRATGLGSANVANLVNNWTPDTRTGTTTTLTIAPSTFAHGSGSVMASGTVTGSGGTPTGEVALVATGTTLPGPGFGTLSAGAYSVAIPDLPGGGPYNVVAKYSGDKTFKPSASGNFSVTVTPEGSSTVISVLSGVTGNPITTANAGVQVIVRVDVAGDSGQGIPTGSVTIADADANDGATLQLNSFGFAELQTSSLSSGSHSFSATYAGDASFNSSASGTANLSITGGGGGGSFTITAAPTAQTVSKGSPATSQITVTRTGSFTGSVTLVAAVTGPQGAANAPSCAFDSSNPISLSSTNTSGMSTMTCTTVAAAQLPYAPIFKPNRPLWIGTSVALALACIFLLSVPMQKKRWSMAFVLIVLAAATAVAGCGGGGGNNGGGGNGGTTSGTYTVTVSSGSATPATFTITVQ